MRKEGDLNNITNNQKEIVPNKKANSDSISENFSKNNSKKLDSNTDRNQVEQFQNISKESNNQQKRNKDIIAYNELQRNKLSNEKRRRNKLKSLIDNNRDDDRPQNKNINKIVLDYENLVQSIPNYHTNGKIESGVRGETIEQKR